MTIEHDWHLVGPWYRRGSSAWRSSEDPGTGAASRPIFQKYASSGFVNEFVKKPWRSLKYTDVDLVYNVTANGGDMFSLSTLGREKTSLRKLFLDTHNRFYLVVCELHCDAPGFPSTAREKTCEAGFVVRRRSAAIPDEVRDEVHEKILTMARAKAKLGRLAKSTSARRRRSAPSQVRSTLDQAAATGQQRQAIKHATAYEKARLELEQLVVRYKLRTEVSGWVPDDKPGVGTWTKVDEMPAEMEEEALPLYPLIPDPTDAGHAAAGRSLWFGILPVSSADVDTHGFSRYDDRQLYEVRCFVRRHVEACPKKATRGDCMGELVWSKPTENYQLASHFDLDGTSNRQVTVQLPDLQALEAQASSMKFGKGASVRFVSPAKSAMRFTVDGGTPTKDPADTGSAQICFFSIPLITIVALFVLRLFLPIVVFVFGLWFLLRLKFCILPTFSLEAGLAFDLQTKFDGMLDVDADLQVKVDGALSNLRTEITDGIMNEDDGLEGNARAKLAFDLASDFSESVPDDMEANLRDPTVHIDAELAQDLPLVTDGLEYYKDPLA